MTTEKTRDIKASLHMTDEEHQEIKALVDEAFVLQQEADERAKRMEQIKDKLKAYAEKQQSANLEALQKARKAPHGVVEAWTVRFLGNVGAACITQARDSMLGNLPQDKYVALKALIGDKEKFGKLVEKGVIYIPAQSFRDRADALLSEEDRDKAIALVTKKGNLSIKVTTKEKGKDLGDFPAVAEPENVYALNNPKKKAA